MNIRMAATRARVVNSPPERAGLSPIASRRDGRNAERDPNPTVNPNTATQAMRRSLICNSEAIEAVCVLFRLPVSSVSFTFTAVMTSPIAMMRPSPRNTASNKPVSSFLVASSTAELSETRWPRARAEVTAMELLERVGIPEQAHKYPAQLSGGQQQRVAIARAIVGERRLILADEPTGALDTDTGEEILRLLRARCDAGAAGVLVTHEARHAAWADRVVFLRDGVVVDEQGGDEPEELLAPEAAR